METQIEFRDLGLKNYKPSKLVIGVPEVGLVGIIALNYMLENLKMKEAGAFDSELFPPIVAVHEARPRYVVRLYCKDEFCSVISEIPFSTKVMNSFGREIVEWSLKNGIESIIGITGIPSRERMMEESNERAKVFVVANDKSLSELFLSSGAESFSEGIVAGVFAPILRNSMSLGMRTAVLLAESYPDFPDPGAAASAIAVLSKALSLSIDVNPLLSESEEIRLRHRELMRRTQQAMQQTAQEIPGIYR